VADSRARVIDLNADVGEAETAEAAAREAALLPLLTSVNVSCGAHAGTALLIRQTILAAGRAGLAVGAHPGYADRANRGRIPLSLTRSDVRQLVLDQLARLLLIADDCDVRVTHVKPHGALYNQAARDEDLAQAIADTVREVSPALRLVGLAGSALLTAGERAGLQVVGEGFADRRYRSDGTLVPRTEPGAVVEEAAAAAEQALAIATLGTVTAVDGRTRVPVAARTLCVHGDTPAALEMARAIRAALEGVGVRVEAVS
jgi:5-oxoprolinase (ATP-hydrolysing) subunit A